MAIRTFEAPGTGGRGCGLLRLIAPRDPDARAHRDKRTLQRRLLSGIAAAWMAGWQDGQDGQDGRMGRMGRMAGWQDGRMAGWQDGRMAGWQDGRMAANSRRYAAATPPLRCFITMTRSADFRSSADGKVPSLRLHWKVFGRRPPHPALRATFPRGGRHGDGSAVKAFPLRGRWHPAIPREPDDG